MMKEKISGIYKKPNSISTFPLLPHFDVSYSHPALVPLTPSWIPAISFSVEIPLSAGAGVKPSFVTFFIAAILMSIE
jgi:hypothetical protein